MQGWCAGNYRVLPCSDRTLALEQRSVADEDGLVFILKVFGPVDIAETFGETDPQGPHGRQGVRHRMLGRPANAVEHLSRGCLCSALEADQPIAPIRSWTEDGVLASEHLEGPGDVGLRDSWNVGAYNQNWPGWHMPKCARHTITEISGALRPTQ